MCTDSKQHSRLLAFILEIYHFNGLSDDKENAENEKMNKQKDPYGEMLLLAEPGQTQEEDETAKFHCYCCWDRNLRRLSPSHIITHSLSFAGSLSYPALKNFSNVYMVISS